MKKKLITKAEITQIVKTYSLRKDEFSPVQGLENSFMSSLAKGYMITIAPEEDTQGATGRILVTHSQWNGRRTFVDIWDRDKNEKLIFRFRNLSDHLPSDREYIHDLEQQNEELLRELKEQREQHKSQKLINDTEKDSWIVELEKEIEALRQENQKLINDTPKHNARGAGRKPSPERQENIEKVKALLDEGCSDADIMRKLQISKATYYRYKRECQ